MIHIILFQILSSDSDGEHDNGPNTISEDYGAAIEQVVQTLQNLNVEDDHGNEITINLFP